MKNYESVLAFGDSHVAGCEIIDDHVLYQKFLIGDIPLSAVDEANKTRSFPNYVAKQLGIPCYNYSMSGGSNDRSMRLLPQALIDHPNSLVLFGYTSSDRVEFYYPDKGLFLGRDDDDYLQCGMQWYNAAVSKNATGAGMTHPINDLFVEKMLRAKQKDYTKTTNQMFYAEHACKSFDSDIRHIFLFPELFKKDTEIAKRLNQKNIIRCQKNTKNGYLNSNTGYGNYQEWAEGRGYTKKEYGHYGQEVHDHFGQFILENL
jgi:hypothetical protein